MTQTCWGLLHCDPCTTGGAIANGGCGTEDAGVSNRSIYCRLDQQYLTQKCGSVYCSKFDEDCWRPNQDNGCVRLCLSRHAALFLITVLVNHGNLRTWEKKL